jgi:probable DNA metabolism protein
MKIPDDFLFYLSMHRECNERLLIRAKEIRAKDLEVSLDRDNMHIKKMVRDVQGEVHRMKAFVRLSTHGSLVLFGYLKPRHRIAEHICDHLARRNAGIIVVLGNGGESWACLCRGSQVWRDHGTGLTQTLERLKAALPPEVCKPGPDPEVLWQAYYDSQYCPERKNLLAYRKNMPRRDQEAAGLRLVQNKKNVTLDDFLGSSPFSAGGHNEA